MVLFWQFSIECSIIYFVNENVTNKQLKCSCIWALIILNGFFSVIFKSILCRFQFFLVCKHTHAHLQASNNWVWIFHQFFPSFLPSVFNARGLQNMSHWTQTSNEKHAQENVQLDLSVRLSFFGFSRSKIRLSFSLSFVSVPLFFISVCKSLISLSLFGFPGICDTAVV